MCSDWVWPWVAAIASMQVRATLLKASCAVSDQPEVCVSGCAGRVIWGSWAEPGDRFAPQQPPARSLATSMKKFIPMPQKNDSRGRNVDVQPGVQPGA